MPKNKTQVVNPPSGIENQEEQRNVNEPLSGSKSVKNKNHSHHNQTQGE